MRCTLNPPPGPLSWLFPELGSDQGPPLLGNRLFQHLAPFDEVGIPDGPRGRCLLRILGQRFRQTGPRISLEEGIPQLELSLPYPVEPGLVWTNDGRWCAPEELPDGTVGILPLRPHRALEDIAAARVGAMRGRIVPVFLTDPEPALHATTRLPESWWGLLPGDKYPDAVRVAYHELMRELWPERFLKFCALENHALAGFDLYDEVVRGRYDREAAETPAERVRRPLILGVDGIDGSGKSTQLSALRGHLESRARSVRVHKIYRHGVFHDTVTELTRQCAGGRNLHLWPLQRRIKLFDSIKYYYREVEPDLSRCDVMIFDRYVQTHLAAGLGRYGHDPHARELMSVYPDPHRVYLLDVPVEVALRRLAPRTTRTVDENPYMLRRYREVLRELATADDRILVLDGRQDRDTIQETIRADVEQLLEVRR